MNIEQIKSSKWALPAIAVVVIIIIAFFAFHKKAVSPAVPENTDTTATTTTPEPLVKKESASISYANALVKYADRRIQLNDSCQASRPNTVTYKDNTGIMIDNRSAKTRTVKVGETYTIKPYGFKIVVLPDVYLKSKTIMVDCDKSQNVATILVQE
jgi:hypothetical protein